MSVNRQTVAYWVTTGLLAAGLVYGGVSSLTLQQASIDTIEPLGYPTYLLMILGVWKLLAVMAILAPGLPRLKEWAYAGVFFGMTGAFVSHVINGSTVDHLISSGSFVLLAIASWALRPRSRMLGEPASPLAQDRVSRSGGALAPSR